MPERELARQAEALKLQVERLSARVTVARKETERLRVLAVVSIIIGAVVTALVVLGAWLWWEVHESVEQNEANQVINCENSNDSREASRVLWNFVIDISIVSEDPNAPPGANEQEEKLLEDIRHWVNHLYRPRDCSSLDTKYEVPKPPPILKELRQLSKQTSQG